MVCGWVWYFHMPWVPAFNLPRLVSNPSTMHCRGLIWSLARNEMVQIKQFPIYYSLSFPRLQTRSCFCIDQTAHLLHGVGTLEWRHFVCNKCFWSYKPLCCAHNWFLLPVLAHTLNNNLFCSILLSIFCRWVFYILHPKLVCGLPGLWKFTKDSYL